MQAIVLNDKERLQIVANCCQLWKNVEHSEMRSIKPLQLCIQQATETLNKQFKMDALLIINSLLVAVCLYFIKDFHSDFKATAKAVRKLREKFNDLSKRMDSNFERMRTKNKEIEKRIEEIEEK